MGSGVVWILSTLVILRCLSTTMTDAVADRSLAKGMRQVKDSRKDTNGASHEFESHDKERGSLKNVSENYSEDNSNTTIPLTPFQEEPFLTWTTDENLNKTRAGRVNLSFRTLGVTDFGDFNSTPKAYGDHCTGTV